MVRHRGELKVVVVGGGPAGSLAAWHLARAGVATTLLEKGPDGTGSSRPCGGMLTDRARQCLPFDISTIIQRQFDTVSLCISGTKLRFSTRATRPLLSSVSRVRLDSFMRDQAANAGADVRENAKAMRVTQDNRQVSIMTAQAMLQADAVVLADGNGSSVSPTLGWSDRPLSKNAISTNIKPSSGKYANLSGGVRFDLGMVPGGYGWVFPASETTSIGLVAVSGIATEAGLAAVLRRYLRQLDLSANDCGPFQAAASPVSFRSDGIARGRVLLAGDAAGLVDPVTSEGIYSALVSGRLAAETIIATQTEIERLASEYRDRLCTHLGNELEAARELARYLYGSQNNLRHVAFRLFGQKLTDAMAEIFTGERTYSDTLKKREKYLAMLPPGFRTIFRQALR